MNVLCWWSRTLPSMRLHDVEAFWSCAKKPNGAQNSKTYFQFIDRVLQWWGITEVEVEPASPESTEMEGK